jgi:ABC-type sugar transport system substrate-binding protein
VSEPAQEEPAKEEPAKEAPETPAETVMTEEDAAKARDAGTLVSDPATGFEKSDATGYWYYSNYPNYKDFAADGKFKVAFVCKFSGAWFTPKNNACKDTCDKYGYEFLFIDANSDEQAWLDGIDNIINQDFDAVIMTPVNTTLLPEAVAKLQEAGIAYLTTDDPGADANGFYSPHYGLYDWWLHNELGKVMCEDMKADGFMDNVAPDYSNFLFVLQDSPAVEAIHNRNQGTYDAVMAAYPDIPEDRIVWLDCGGSLAEEHLEKFSSTLQANKDTVDYWLISGGGASATVPTMTLLKEAGIDIANNVRMSECFSTADPMIMMMEDPAVAAANYGVGLVPYPSGVGMIELFRELFENGTPLPAFTGYALNVVKDDTVEEFYNTYYK